MEVNGYEVGAAPTEEELEIYKRVKRHLVAKRVADCLRKLPELTQEEFDFVVMLADVKKPGADWPSIAVYYLNEIEHRK